MMVRLPWEQAVLISNDKLAAQLIKDDSDNVVVPHDSSQNPAHC